MTLLADAAYACRTTDAERRNVDRAIQDEVVAAKRIQRQTRSSWSAALARAKTEIRALHPLP